MTERDSGSENLSFNVCVYFTFICVCVCERQREREHTCAEIKRNLQVSCSITLHLISWKQDLSLNLKLTISARLALVLQQWGSRDVGSWPHIYVGERNSNWGAHACSVGTFSQEAISPVPKFGRCILVYCICYAHTQNKWDQEAQVISYGYINYLSLWFW